MSEIRIPYRDRDQPLDVEALDLPRALQDTDERAVARHLIFEATIDPELSTVGDLLDRIEHANPGERRRIADEARAACGLTTFTELERQRDLARATRWPPPPPSAPARDVEGRAHQQCHAPGCEFASTTPEGVPLPVAARRWFCQAHRHLAQPGDLEPLDEPIRLDEFGNVAMRPEALEHYSRLDEQAACEFRERTESQEAEAEAISRARERYEREADVPEILGFDQRQAQFLDG